MTLFAEVGRDAGVRDLPDVGKLRKMAVEVLDVARGAGCSPCGHTLGLLRNG